MLFGLSLLAAFRLRAPLQQGRDSLSAAETALSRGDVTATEAAFAEAARSFREASDNPTNPILRAAGVLPWLGRTPDTLLALSEIGGDVSAAGRSVMRRIARLPGPGGLASLGPQEGRVPIERLSSLLPEVRRATVVLNRAHLRV
ncbi:MAG: hypothetical protein ABR518_00285, partial [Actinomycetota bacterium]